MGLNSYNIRLNSEERRTIQRMLRSNPFARLPSSYVSFDLETTGLNPQRDGIIELSGAKVLDDRIVDEFSTLVSCNIQMTSTAYAINGISNEMLIGAPSLKSVLSDFFSFSDKMILLGHNIIRFDRLFLKYACLSSSIKMPDFSWFDTIELASRMFIGPLGLSALCERLEVENHDAHRALSDCIATHNCYQAMKLILVEASRQENR